MNLTLAKKLVGGMYSLQERNRVYSKGVKEIDITPLDIIDIYHKQRGLCYWSNLELDSRYNNISWHPKAISADRIDNEIGYTPDNVVLCWRLWNLGRATYPPEGFKIFIEELKKDFKVDHKGINLIDDFML